MDGFKITTTPEWDALNAFDAENNVEPARVIAERLSLKWSSYYRPDMVDDIANAIEDAMTIGARRGPLEAAAIASNTAEPDDET